MHKIVYLPIMQNDLFEAIDYLEQVLDAPGAADDLLDQFDAAVQHIARFPYSHELYRTNRPLRDEIRKIPIKGFVLYYAVFEDYVELRRFIHGRRKRDTGIE